MNVYPAMRATMGSWNYYIVKMTMRSIAAQVKFANEIYEDKTLEDAIQRVLDESRAESGIATYLIRQPDRFFSSIVVAALRGEPKWFPVTMEDDERFELLQGDSRFSDTFGVLSFDGQQEYYALDGQHRLAAIRALIEPSSDLHHSAPEGFKDEEISVIMVVPDKDEGNQQFMRRYRRLFGNLNRYAKQMDKVDNIIMDEDDPFAIVTRQLVSEHEFFKWTGREKESQRIKTTKGINFRSTDGWFTSLVTLYEMNIRLLANQKRETSGWDETGADQNLFCRFRPSDEILEGLYAELSLYWDSLIKIVPELTANPTEMRDHSATEESDTKDSVLFWPIGQQLSAELARDLLNFRQANPDTPTANSVSEALAPLGDVDWDLHNPPWRHLLLIPDSRDEADFSSWKMRNEERKPAVALAKRIVKWQIGLDPLAQEEIDSLRNDWELMLVPSLDLAAVESLWQVVEDASQR